MTLNTDLSEWLSLHIDKTKSMLRRPSVDVKIKILSKIFGREVLAEEYEAAARKAGFSYHVCKSRHYVNDSAKSWYQAGKMAGWLRDYGSIAPEKIVFIDDVCNLTGLRKIDIRNLIEQGCFPQGIRTSRHVMWHIESIDAWIKQQ